MTNRGVRVDGKVKSSKTGGWRLSKVKFGDVR